MYDLKALDIFNSVIRHGSQTATAREFGLPKSTVSRRLKDLEGQVGHQLLRRDANRMVPTEAGLVFEKYSRAILKLTEDSRETLSDLRKEVSGDLTLHVHEGLIRGWFAKQMERFIARYPHVRIALRTNTELPAMDGKDTVCIWLGPVPEEIRLRQETLGRLTRGLFAHPDYLARQGAPRHPRELSHHKWVDLLGDSGDGLTLRHSREGKYSVTLPVSQIQVDRMALQGDAIVSGHGIGLLPHWMVKKRSHYHPGTLVPCLPDWHAAPLAVRLLYPDTQLPRRSLAFIEHIRAAIPGDWAPHSPAHNITGAETETAGNNGSLHVPVMRSKIA
ncbi:LysR family transcriptional regulator [uncultured Nisaea sp.]|uniref:LysR family transcriptional regulator n=1 Tax=uncultured Nisaea sp. TaxID=538215 RepID=UPI0030ED1133|tara:strand:+ start:577 stop:1572 length:996 start_codon:yes stop_codon:yes gene_type:complete